MLILADWAVAISFYSLLNLLHPVWTVSYTHLTLPTIATV